MRNSLASVSEWAQKGRRPWTIITLLASLLSIAAFANGLGGEFVVDDRPFLIDNPNLSAPHSLAYFFTGDVFSYSNLTDAYSASYRPLFFATLWIIDAAGMASPFALHSFNLSLHVVTTLLVLMTIVRVMPGISPSAAAVGTLVFALHPVHSEAVAWVGAFVHPLATLFILTSFLFYSLEGRLHKSISLGLALLCYGLALLTNEVVAAFPFFLLSFNWLQYKRLRLGLILPFFMVLAGYVLVRQAVLGEALPLNLSNTDTWLRLPTYTLEYLRYLVLPWPQSFYLAMPEGWGLQGVSFLAIAFLILLCVLVLRRLPKEVRPALLALAWIMFALAPVLAASFSPNVRFALRSLYLASVGLAFFAAWLTHSFGLTGRPAPVAAVVLVLCLAVGGTVVANQKWQDDGRIYQAIIDANPADSGGYLGAARFMELSGRTEDAISLYEVALLKTEGEAYYDVLEQLGTILGQSGFSVRSLEVFRLLLSFQPNNSRAWVGTGNNLWAMGQLDEAETAYQKAILADRANWEACYNMMLLLRQVSKPEKALKFAACSARP